MSEEFQTLTAGIKIHSTDTGDYYSLDVVTGGHQTGGENFDLDYSPAIVSETTKYSHAEYATLLKREWQSALRGKKPKILGYEIPNESLARETIHFLSPGNLGEWPQVPSRKELTYWLLYNNKRIFKKANIPGLIDSLEYIIAQDFNARVKMKNRGKSLKEYLISHLTSTGVV